jgi:hypothetical protein
VRGEARKNIDNVLTDPFAILQDVVVPEAEDFEAFVTEEVRSTVVIR